MADDPGAARRPQQLCANCQRRLGTENWYGDTTAMGWVHMFPRLWCRLCCAREQLAYAKARAAEIPELELEIQQLEAVDG